MMSMVVGDLEVVVFTLGWLALAVAFVAGRR